MTQTGADLIADERRRQIEVEGWTPDHDAGHGPSPLLRAAEAYEFGNRAWWPWDAKWWKPKDALSDLIRAGALFLAARDAGATASASTGARRCAEKIDAILARAAALSATATEDDRTHGGNLAPLPDGSGCHRTSAPDAATEAVTGALTEDERERLLADELWADSYVCTTGSGCIHEDEAGCADALWDAAKRLHTPDMHPARRADGEGCACHPDGFGTNPYCRRHGHLVAAPTPPELLYHWSPSKNRESIQTHGLTPGRPANSGDWNAPHICLAGDPIAARGLCHGTAPLDLWMVRAADCVVVTEANDGAEWRTFQPVEAALVAPNVGRGGAGG